MARRDRPSYSENDLTLARALGVLSIGLGPAGAGAALTIDA